MVVESLGFQRRHRGWVGLSDGEVFPSGFHHDRVPRSLRHRRLAAQYRPAATIGNLGCVLDTSLRSTPRRGPPSRTRSAGMTSRAWLGNLRDSHLYAARSTPRAGSRLPARTAPALGSCSRSEVSARPSCRATLWRALSSRSCLIFIGYCLAEKLFCYLVGQCVLVVGVGIAQDGLLSRSLSFCRSF
jgi:hypothetical protein